MTSGNEMTTKKDRAAGVSMVDHPHGLGAAAVHHPLGILNQEISLKRGGVKSREKSQVMERREGDLAADVVQGTEITNTIGISNAVETSV